MDTSSETQNRDRRVLRTKNLLRNAILNLTAERGGFTAIQINEITDEANVARSTFYLHYSDKEELLYDALQWEFNKMYAEMQHLYNQEYAPIIVQLLFQYIHQHPRYFTVTLTCVGTTKAFEQTRAIFEEWITRWMDFSVFNPSMPSHLILQHISGSVMNLIKWWLETDNDYSPEELFEYYTELVYSGVLKIIGLTTKDELGTAFLAQANPKLQKSNPAG